MPRDVLGTGTRVRRYCDKCLAVSLVPRRKKHCPLCGQPLVLTKEVQGRWSIASYRPDVTGEPPMKIEQPWLPGLEPEGDKWTDETTKPSQAGTCGKPIVK